LRAGEDPIGFIDKMIRCKIFRGPAPETDEGHYNVRALQFTEKFIHSCNDTLTRLAMDPVNNSLNMSEGFKSLMLNFVKEKELKEL
jgi:hypothetical protein